MIFEEKKIVLKDGRTAVLRSPCVEDAEKLMHFIIRTYGETEFLLRYPEEKKLTIQKEEAWVQRVTASPDTLVIVCYIDGEVVGNCEIDFMTTMKTAHRATIGITVLKAYWALGIGSALFEEMIVSAQKRGTEIMELEFVEGNDRARHLYEKFGFHIVSERPKVLKLKDGSYRSEFYMQKYLKCI